MIKDLEAHSMKEDVIAGVATNVIAIADDVAPCAMAESPREVVHRMQLLLNIVEDHGVQNHMEFGKDKCKLLIAADLVNSTLLKHFCRTTRNSDFLWSSCKTN